MDYCIWATSDNNTTMSIWLSEKKIIISPLMNDICYMYSWIYKYMLWGTVPSVGNVAQPPLGKPVGSEVGWQDPRPWISSPVGNQACIGLRLLWDLLLLKNSLTLNWGSKCLLSIFIFPESGLDPPGMGHSPFNHLHCKCTPLMYSVTSSPVSAKITTQNKPMNNKWGPSLT